MIAFFYFSCRSKKGMLEIASDISNEILEKYLDPIQKLQLPDSIVFKVVKGKKKYDVIGLHNSWLIFFSQRVIDVLSTILDMSDISYPIKIENIDEPYYVIHNLTAIPFLNKDDLLSMYEPRYYFMPELCSKIFGVDGTDCIMVSEEVKNALLKNKITNIELIEGFGCTQEEYEEIKRTKFQPKVHVFRDK